MVIRGETIKYCEEARKRRNVEDKLRSNVEARNDVLASPTQVWTALRKMPLYTEMFMNLN